MLADPFIRPADWMSSSLSCLQTLAKASIRECEVIQWFVEPEARVEQFDKLCEVQSDKASVEITSRFDGVIKKLHYEAGDMAIVGKPLVDIDIQSDISPDDEAITTPPAEQAGAPTSPQQPQKAVEQPESAPSPSRATSISHPVSTPPPPSTSHASLATPAVRHLTKELNVLLSDVRGTGRDGRVLKEDVHRFVSERDNPATSPTPAPASSSSTQTETAIPLTPIQNQMFKTMTRSLSIPHFLYSDDVDFTELDQLRRRMNARISSKPQEQTPGIPAPIKLTSLPFILKAVSLALSQYPLINCRVEIPDPSTGSSSQQKPQLIQRAHHNLSIAISTPQGLIVPNIKDVGSKSILSIAHEISELQRLALAGKLTAAHLTGGTFTVSNIGSIGGSVVSPVIVSGEVAIVGVGRGRDVPVFKNRRSGSPAEDLELERRTLTTFSYAADHRVVDGATAAKMAECVRGYLEDPGWMMTFLR
ncbi:MAG: hypothetical protein M4579_001064 [Chaenotheca gracillima]|nr:MAG: hypothetical protein M4579_001064 [Chaenotheca gracillima]